MNIIMIEKLRQLPRHGVPSQASRGQGIPPTSPASASPSAGPGPAVGQAVQQAVSNVNQQVQQMAQALAQEMIAEQQQQQQIARMGRTFTKFDMVNDVVSNQKEVVTAGLWSDNVASLTTYFTGSAQTTTQRRYYVDVFQKDVSSEGSSCQFALAYGHAEGSGSDSVGQLNDSPSKAIYGQYRQLLLNPNDSRFTTGDGDTDSIYVINFKRSRLKERLDPGNFEIPLLALSASGQLNATGSLPHTGSTVLTLIDDSSATAATIGDSGKMYNIVSGSINNGIHNPTSPVYYGLAYPDHGVLILDGNKLDANLGFQTNTGSSSEGNNHFRLYHALSGSGTLVNPSTSDTYGFLARNSEQVTSTHYFVRIKNAEYNFSNNPSYITGSVGSFSQTSFVGDPKVYITTVGLYNNSRELLAVAKLSKPLLKSFSREALIRVKLDY